MSFFLAVTILFTTTSFTVDMHFCCNQLVDMTFFGKARTCTVMGQEKNDNSKHCTSIQEKDCCDSHTVVKEGDDTFQKSNTISEIKTLVFLNTYFYTYIHLFEGSDSKVISFQTYRPPLISTDIIILNETFLI
ncbi:HYC_CC_PP family protein [Gelidibacter japonicus]|uniref:HYC_CC_PP family protein n=1 Tax=Gelidibacter japonicus TaxID=1962232 RepID=UPI003A8DF88B